MKHVTKILDKLQLVMKQLSSILMIIFTTLVFLQVFTRYFLKNPLTWTEQLARYLFIWMIMLYMPILIREKGNMAFDVIAKRLPKIGKEIFILITEIMIAAFAVMYFISSLEFCFAFSSKLLIGLNINANYIYSSQVVGSFTLLLFTLELIYYHVVDMKKYLKEKKVGEN